MRTLLAVLALLVCACAPQPEYMVRIQEHSNGAYCTGLGISPQRILTVNHCTDDGFDEAVLPNGKIVNFVVTHQWPDADLALLETDMSLELNQYARFEEGGWQRFGHLFGLCRYSPTVRLVSRSPQIDWQVEYCQTWMVAWAYSCSGDSGGGIDLDGAVAGMVSLIQDWDTRTGILEGNIICVVPASLIESKLAEVH